MECAGENTRLEPRRDVLGLGAEEAQNDGPARPEDEEKALVQNGIHQKSEEPERG